jgi:hypothetical protein
MLVVGLDSTDFVSPALLPLEPATPTSLELERRVGCTPEPPGGDEKLAVVLSLDFVAAATGACDIFPRGATSHQAFVVTIGNIQSKRMRTGGMRSMRERVDFKCREAIARMTKATRNRCALTL